MDKKFAEPLGSEIDQNNNNKLIADKTSLVDENESVKKMGNSFSNSTASNTNSTNVGSISMANSATNLQSSKPNLFTTNQLHQIPRKTSQSDSSCPNQFNQHKIKQSPDRKFSLSLLTSNAADRLKQRKCSLQPQNHFPHQTVLPNFMGLFLAEDQQQLISIEPQSTTKQTAARQESIGNYLQTKSSRGNQQTNSSLIPNLSSNLSYASGVSKKKYSESSLPGLLKDEFFFTQSFSSSTTSSIDDVNSQNSSLINENIIGANEFTTQSITTDLNISSTSATLTNVNTLQTSPNNNTGKRRTTLGSLTGTNRSVVTVSGFKLNNSILEQQETKVSSNDIQPTNLSSTNSGNQTNFLHYLPFRRFSKRAQSDPWIGERLFHRLPYTGNRRFTLGTTADNLFHADEEDKRTLAISELYNTEKSYVESLRILVNNYMHPLRVTNFIDRSVIEEIFYQIPEILEHHELFLVALQARLECWDNNQSIGDIFRETFTKQSIIDTYTEFINNFQSANDSIKTACQTKPNFAKFLETKSRENKNKYSLDDYLILPVQRIPRYELMIKDLLKYTDVQHPDHKLLKLAQQDIHELAVNINNIEKETAQLEKDIQKLREIEACIEGAIELVQHDRKFVHHESVMISDGLQGVKKERYLLLFNDLLLITSAKKKTAANRKISASSSGTSSPFSTLEGNKHKCIQRYPLELVEITKRNETNVKKAQRELEVLKEDQCVVNKMIELSKIINCNHTQLDEQLNSLKNSIVKQLSEKTNQDNILVSLEMNAQTAADSTETFSIIFSNIERRLLFESKFLEFKQQLSGKEFQAPLFLREIALPKTRAGLLFQAASPTLPFRTNLINTQPQQQINQSNINQRSVNLDKSTNKQSFIQSPMHTSINTTGNQNLNIGQQQATTSSCSSSQTSNIEVSIENEQDVWICNSDGYVGQVCVLSLRASDPTVTSCNGVCNSRILCIVAVPAFSGKETLSSSETKGNNSPDLNKFTEKEINTSATISDNKEQSSNQDKVFNEKLTNQDKETGINSEYNQPTMWLGTESKTIHLYNCNDNIRIKKNKIKVTLNSSVNTIVYLNNKVFAGLNSGELVIFSRNQEGKWLTDDYELMKISEKPIVKLASSPVNNRLWVGIGNEVFIYDAVAHDAINELQKINIIKVANDNAKTVQCLTIQDYSVWISTARSSQVKLYHATTLQFLLEINVAPTVNRLLNEFNDNIIKQHKTACLRITALLACKQVLWIGTSAGIICTFVVPSVTEDTNQVPSTARFNNVSYGHTGHVRFLTCVDLNVSNIETNLSNLITSASSAAQQQQLETILRKGQAKLIISGGDGFENYNLTNNSSSNEGKGDSTNHLLLWVV